jgi:isocitrate dehydrogenase kinase/phosphatase
MTIEEAATQISKLIIDTFDSYNAEFIAITHRAKHKFEEKDWQGSRSDANERFDLYEHILDRITVQIQQLLGDQAKNKLIWIAAKPKYECLITKHYDIDRAETFFNSVTRKILSTVGVDREVEFFYLTPKVALSGCGGSIYKTYTPIGETKYLIEKILKDFKFKFGYENVERDAAHVTQEVDLYLWPLLINQNDFSIDVVTSIFYRNKEAYIVGRIRVGSTIIPLILPLVNGENGIYVDAVLLLGSEASIVFSFAYSYFHVEVERYDALIEFLRSILPQKEIAELYTSIGYNRHGKTEFYRSLHRFVHISKEQFVIAPGLEGAVMMVFTLPHYEFVFKVIKDRPCFIRSNNETPKAITKTEVMRRYDFVCHRDRAGRMIDTQEFENLKFKKKRFSGELLNEFIVAGREAVTIAGDYVIVHHLYVQRKVTPLPIYLQTENNPEAIRNIIIDFGYFLKDIAGTGVFPTDLFNTWNYGVTQRGRVVLYDYDDVVPLEKVNFRVKPHPRDEFEEMEPEENWILASPDDFFMDELDRYSGIPHPLKGIFKSVHNDLYTLRFWDDIQAKIKSDEIIDVIPYDRTKRFSKERNGYV